MKIVVASARGMVSHTPDTPMNFGRIRMNKTTSIKERREEINAEITPFPRAVKYPERNKFKTINRNTGLNNLKPSHVKVNTFHPSTNKWMICFPHNRETASISTELRAMVIKLYRVVSFIFV